MIRYIFSLVWRKIFSFKSYQIKKSTTIWKIFKIYLRLKNIYGLLNCEVIKVTWNMSGFTTSNVLRKGVENRETMETNKKNIWTNENIWLWTIPLYPKQWQEHTIDYSGVSSRNFDLHAFLNFVLVLIETFNMDCSYHYWCIAGSWGSQDILMGFEVQYFTKVPINSCSNHGEPA